MSDPKIGFEMRKIRLPLENIIARTSCVLGTRLGVTVIEPSCPRQRGRKVTEMDVGRRGYASRQQNAGSE